MPPYPSLIERLRRELNITQSALAKRLTVSAMSVSRWERGVQEPSSQVFVRLGRLASGDLRWTFWEYAGLEREHLIDSADSGGVAVPPAHFVHIPLLDAHLGASLTSDFISGSSAIDFLSAPASWSPHPEQTICAFVEGDSMEPLIRDGSIACLDTAEHSPSALLDQIVVSQHPQLGTKLSWLRSEGDGFVFRSEDPSVPPVIVTPEWKIVGKLLWWLTRTGS